MARRARRADEALAPGPVPSGFVLIFTTPMVRVHINSDVNTLGIGSMPIVVAEWVAANVGSVWPAFVPSIGALGAFMAGSNTVTNLRAVIPTIYYIVAAGIIGIIGNIDPLVDAATAAQQPVP
jgi:hypothetical protein